MDKNTIFDPENPEKFDPAAYERWLKTVTQSKEADIRNDDHAFKAELASGLVTQLKSLRVGLRHFNVKRKIDFPKEAQIANGKGMYQWHFKIGDGVFNAAQYGRNQPLQIRPSSLDEPGSRTNQFSSFEDNSINNQYFDTLNISSVLYPGDRMVSLAMEFSQPLAKVIESLNEAFVSSGLRVKPIYKTDGIKSGTVITAPFQPSHSIAIIGEGIDPKEIGIFDKIVREADLKTETDWQGKEHPILPTPKESKAATQLSTEFTFTTDDLDRVITAFERYAEKERMAVQHPDIPPPGSSGQART